jgi:hypothetical protein
MKLLLITLELMPIYLYSGFNILLLLYPAFLPLSSTIIKTKQVSGSDITSFQYDLILIPLSAFIKIWFFK